MNTANTVHSTVGAGLVPESSAVIHCAVVVVDRVTEPITSVTRVPGHTKGVVGLFRQHSERTVLGVVPAEVCT